MKNSEAQPNSPLVLVVDDERFTRLQLRKAMEQAGYRVVEAQDGTEALALFAQMHPDIVLLDALMPVMDGFSCCTQLQLLPGGLRTPILMITALEDQDSVDKAFSAGATDYITKPIHSRGLCQRVYRLLQASQATETLRQQQAQSRLNEECLQLALDAAHMGTWDWDIVSGKVTYSANARVNLGLTPNTIDDSYESFLEIVHPEDRNLVTHAVDATIAQKIDYDIEFRIIWRDGTIHWLASKGQVYYDTSGRAVRMTGINMDITQRKLAEQERLQLLAQEQASRAEAEAVRESIANILASITDGFFAVDQEWRFTYLNPRAEQLLHKTREKLLGKSIWDQFPEVVETVFYEQFYKAVSQQASVEFQAFYPPLNMWVEVHAYPAKDGLSVYFQDITQRQEAAAELQRQNLRSQLFAEVSLNIRRSLHIDEILQTSVTEVQKFLQADRVFIFELWQDGSGKVVKEAVVPGCSPILGRNITDPCFKQSYLDSYRQGRIGSIDNLYKSGVEPCYIKFLEQFDVKANLVVPIFIKENLWGLLIAHQCKHPRQWSSFETELLRQLSDQIGIALAQAELLADETRHSQELISANAELQQFASIASHDLQEPLRKIQTFGNRLKVMCGDALSEQGLDYLERMQNAAQRMQALIDDLLTLSRVTTRVQPFVAVNLAEVTAEVLNDLEVLIQQQDAQVSVGDLPIIEGDRIQMRQLLQNLITNALKFHPKGEPPIVNISSRLLAVPIQTETNSSADMCEIIIEDKGIGFDEKYLDRIFNVFQRLHSRSEYEGTGMGLAICRKIAERHGGHITATSKPGQGAGFIVTLPIKHNRGDA